MKNDSLKNTSKCGTAFAHQRLSNNMCGFRRKLEAEEQARTAAFRSRMDHLNKIAKGYESKVGTVLQQQKEQEEALVMQQLEARDRKQEERERREKEMRMSKARYDLDFNKKMMEMKQKEKEQDRVAAIELRKRLEQEAQEAQRRERQEAEQRRMKHTTIKIDLDQQMALVHENKRREKAGLSESEMNINKVRRSPLMCHLRTVCALLFCVIDGFRICLNSWKTIPALWRK